MWEVFEGNIKKTQKAGKCRNGDFMKKCNLSIFKLNINKQFNILNPSTRTTERFEQSWTALRRFKTDMCGAAIQYLGAEGATFVKFLLLIIWLQPSSLTASARAAQIVSPGLSH